MNINSIPTYCINLKERKNKKNYIKKHFKKFGISNYNFFFAEKHKNPIRGCLESHLSVIKLAIQNNYKSVLIFEDDVKLLNNLEVLENVPSDWDMLYLGGTVHRIINRDNPNWTKVCCWTTHAYIINLNNNNLINLILSSQNYDKEIDRFYLEYIHKNYNCYMINPMVAIQKEGFSDIENREVNYNFMQKTLEGLMLPEHSINNGNYVLKLPDIQDDDLPNISIITPTYNRRKIFHIALNNFENFIYPKNKIEWIIIDDTPEHLYTLDDILPKDPRIKYHLIKSDKLMYISQKRNIAVSKASNDIIVHMDDDDYYPPESLLARVKILMKYKNEGIRCVGCSKIGVYDLINNVSSMSSDSPISLSEASMAYTKDFWTERNFDNNAKIGEHKYFTETRLNEIIDIPYSFVIIAINHKNNFTSSLRNINNNNQLKNNNNEITNFFDTWDLETQMFMLDMKQYILKS